LGGGPPLRCSRASLRERNGHLTSPASFHTAGRIEGRALSLFSRKENERKDKTQSAVDQPKTHKTSIYKTKNKQVVTHLTSRHAERNKKRGSFGARILVPPLGGNTKQRSSVPISICASQPGGRRGLAFGWVLLFFSSLWVFGFSPENNIFLRRGGQVHCGRAAKQTALLRSVGGGTKTIGVGDWGGSQFNNAQRTVWFVCSLWGVLLQNQHNFAGWTTEQRGTILTKWFSMTRLETRTKESNMFASFWVR